jgi:signal transduction histidine kinase
VGCRESCGQSFWADRCDCIGLAGLEAGRAFYLQNITCDLQLRYRDRKSTLPICIRGHTAALEQLVLNLLMNAIDSLHSTHGRRLIRVITENGHPGGVHVSIEDTGSGIHPSDVDRIFKPLFTTKSHGMGMGLAICRSIVEAHHGRIWVSPAAGRGSIFHFTLPANGHEG